MARPGAMQSVWPYDTSASNFTSRSERGSKAVRDIMPTGGIMPQRPKRETVDLSQYPGLVVIYLGMRVNTLTGFKTLLGFGPKISGAVDAKPEGLLLHENLLFSPRHLGMREYWRDFESLEIWSRSEPHRV